MTLFQGGGQCRNHRIPHIITGSEGKSLDLYLPGTTWYDWYTRDAVTDQGGVTITVSTPLDHIPVNTTLKIPIINFVN